MKNTEKAEKVEAKRDIGIWEIESDYFYAIQNPIIASNRLKTTFK